MAFKNGVILGPVVINSSGSAATNIGSASASGTISFGGANLGMFTVDCGTAGINIGSTATAHLVDIASTAAGSSSVLRSGSGGINLETSGGALNIGATTLSLSSDNAASSISIANAAASKSVTIGSTNTTSSLSLKFGTGDFSLSSAAGTIIRSLDTGETTMPLQSAFLARKTTDQLNTTGAGTTVKVGYDAEVFDQNSDYDGVDTFTAPVNGRYCFSASVRLDQVGATSTACGVYFFTTDRFLYLDLFNVAACRLSTEYISSGTAFTAMDAGDTCYVVSVVANMAGNTVDITWGSESSVLFSGFLVC